MLAKAFVVAMAADIARSDYAKPTLIRSRSREWLIACRWGPDGEYLSIATAGVMLDPGGARGARRHRPDPQPVRRAGFGIARRKPPAPFCWCANCPSRSSLAGTFFPADGYARLQQRETISLVCKARYSHSCGWLDGREVRKDIPDPAPSSAEAMAWHIEATALPMDRRVHFRADRAGAARRARRRRLARRAEPAPATLHGRYA